jgi:hypothetical protein
MVPVTIGVLLLLGSTAGFSAQLSTEPDQWRKEKRLIDLHEHINSNPDHIKRAVQILDRAGVGVGVNLSGGTSWRMKLHPEGSFSI